MKTHRITKFPIAALYLALFCAGSNGQEVIAFYQSTENVGGRAIRTNATFSFGIGDSLALVHPIFDNLQLNFTDVGRVFTVTAANDPDFSFLVEALTDGTRGSVGIQFGGGVSIREESVFFNPLPPGNGIDFQGYRIDSIALRVDALSFATPGSNPNGDGVWTDMSFSGAVLVYGAPVPEPSVFVLCTVALLAAALLSKKRRCRLTGNAR